MVTTRAPLRAALRPSLPGALQRASTPRQLRVGSRSKLKPADMLILKSAAGGMHPLLAEVGDVAASTGVMPRKELFEAWEVATRIDAAFPRAHRVADCAAGHGLLAWLLLLLGARRGVTRTAVCVDVTMPPSADVIADAFTTRWPSLTGSLHYVEGGIECVVADSGTLVASVHACGPLTDGVLETAVRGGAAAAVMPCCHSLRKQRIPSALSDLTNDELRTAAAKDGAARAIDEMRIAGLRARGYSVATQRIPAQITPFNRLILATPPGGEHDRGCEDKLHEPAVGKQRDMHGRAARPALIPLGDSAAIAAMAGRREYGWRRSIELSVWMEEDGPLDAEEIRALADRCTRDGVGAPPPPRVEATLREVYVAPGCGRRACSFAVSFSRDTEISRADVVDWQTRMREVLGEMSAGGAAFVLR